jgi:RNA polymerase sigma-70 factor (ECF subfamily)
MDAGGHTGSRRHTLGLPQALSSGHRPLGTTRSPSRPGVGREAETKTNGRPPPLRLSGSFDAFYQDEYSGLVQLAFVLSGSRYGAEDIAQDALVAAWKKWRELEQPLAWTRRAVANLAVSTIRRRIAEGRAMVRLAVGHGEPIAELPEPDTEFWAAVRALPTRQRQMLALYYLGDCSVGEIAATMGCAEGTVRATLHKGRLALAKRLRLGSEEEGS